MLHQRFNAQLRDKLPKYDGPEAQGKEPRPVLLEVAIAMVMQQHGQDSRFQNFMKRLATVFSTSIKSTPIKPKADKPAP